MPYTECLTIKTNMQTAALNANTLNHLLICKELNMVTELYSAAINAAEHGRAFLLKTIPNL